MQEVGYFEAWSAWANGSTEQLTLWGHTMLFWGRAGKIVQFAAALAIVAEILGPERIRAYGASMKTVSLESLFHSVTDQKSNSAVLIIAPAVPLALAAAYYAVGWISYWFGPRPVLYFWLGLVIFALLFIPAAYLSVLLVWGGSVLLDKALRGVARALEQPKVERVVKAVSAVLLVVGFQFDLLAS